jgi:hypothetical protein
MLVLLLGDYPYRAESSAAAQQIGADHARNQTLGRLMVDETDKLLAARAISAQCHRVMLSCFNMVPAGRPTAAALLADQWFTAGAPYPQPVRPHTGPACTVGAAAEDSRSSLTRACRAPSVPFFPARVRRCARSRARRRQCRRRRTSRTSSSSCLISRKTSAEGSGAVAAGSLRARALLLNIRPM